jgi:hypothetical protein
MMNMGNVMCLHARPLYVRLAAAAVVGGTLMPAAPAAADSWQRLSERRSGEKTQYHLFRPTPRHLMRELSTDRPDVTESPYTVDAGHFQVEMSFVEYGRDDGGDFSEVSYFPANLKVGVTNSIDLQLVVTPLLDQEADVGRFGLGSESESGFGSTQLRVKWNVWGNDGGPPPLELPGRLRESALAVMPFVQFPTGEEELGFADQVEWGVIVPLAVPLNEDYGLGLMAELDVVRDADDDGYAFALVHTASVSRGLAGNLGGFAEYVGVASTEESTSYAASLGVGLTYGLSDDVQLDGGINVGLNEEAEDFRVFAGISFRL